MLRGAAASLCIPPRRQAGLSLVEMLVGIAVGLIIVAAASMTVAAQLSDNRRLLMELQLQQDLRAATDIISRELRRAGFWVNAGSQLSIPGTTIENQRNPRVTLTPSSGATSTIEYQYDRVGPSASTNLANRFGFCLGLACPSSSPGTIRSKLSRPDGVSAWHELTDDKAVNITAMTVTPVVGAPVRMACPNLCPGSNDTTCWPTVAIREAVITITGHSATDPSVQRTLTSRVRIRNDQVTLSVPGAAAGMLVACPAS